MTGIRNSNSYGSLTKAALVAFESRHQIDLPPDYREFLLKHNGGRPQPRVITFVERGRETDTDINSLYGIHNGADWAQLEWRLQCFRGRIIASGIAIGSDSGGNQFVLIHRGDRFGEIFFWDHERETDPPSFQNMSFVAPSFTDLLGSLHELKNM